MRRSRLYVRPDSELYAVGATGLTGVRGLGLDLSIVRRAVRDTLRVVREVLRVDMRLFSRESPQLCSPIYNDGDRLRAFFLSPQPSISSVRN